MPASIKDKVIEFLNETYKYSGERSKPALLTYNELGNITKERYGYSAARRNPKVRKLFLEEQLKLAKLAAFRYWSTEEKITGAEMKKIRDRYKEEEQKKAEEDAEKISLSDINVNIGPIESNDIVDSGIF